MPTSSQRRDQAFSVESFMKQMAPKEEIDFYGVKVPVPTDAPLSYTLKAQEIAESDAQDQQNILELLSDILGEEKAAEIEAANPGVRACGVLLLWALQNASGQPITFPEAYEKYIQQEEESRKQLEGSEEGEGKPKVAPLNRSERRAAQRSGRKSVNTSR